MNNIRKKLPLRIIKTCVSLFISYTTLPMFTSFTPFFAGMGAMRAMRESMALSVEVIREQTLANVIGMVLAFIFGLTLGTNPFSATLSVFVLFMILKILDWKDSYVIAAITMTSIILLSTNNQMLFERGFDRVLATLYGMLISFGVNFILFKPKFANDIRQHIDDINQLSIKWMKQIPKRNAILKKMNQSLELLSHQFELAMGDYEFNRAFLLKDEKNVKHLESYVEITKKRIKLNEVVTNYHNGHIKEMDHFIEMSMAFEKALALQIFGQGFSESDWLQKLEEEHKKIMSVFNKVTVDELLSTTFELNLVYALQTYINTVKLYLR